MSTLARNLMRKNAAQLFTGSLTGSGSISIPAGVVSVSLTGKGGVGGDDSWYDPGQPYIAPSGYHEGQPYIAPSGYHEGQPYIAPSGYNAGQPYIAPTYGWTLYSQGGPSNILPQYEPDYSFTEVSPTPAPTALGQAKTVNWLTGSPGAAYFNYKVYASYVVNPGQPYIAPYYENPGQPYIAPYYENPGQPYIESYYDYPGQPYIAPTSGGGPYYGVSSTVTLNGVTKTWQGGYGAGVQGSESTQLATSNGTGQTLTYSVAPGTTMNYSYEV